MYPAAPLYNVGCLPSNVPNSEALAETWENSLIWHSVANNNSHRNKAILAKIYNYVPGMVLRILNLLNV